MLRRIVLLVILLGPGVGCLSTVTPPEDPSDPVTVFLVRDAWHKGLILPDGEGAWTEWGYGDRGWWAENENAFCDVFDTVLWPTPGTLGRTDRAPMEAEDVPRRRRPAEALPIRVERERMVELRRRLLEFWDARRDEIRENRVLNVMHVPAESGFWMFHNCNDAMADWLEELGCDVSWAPLRLGMDVAGAD